MINLAHKTDAGRSLPEALFIIGAGHFGFRAARLLSGKGGRSIWVVDKDKEALDQFRDLNVHQVEADGVAFLTERADLFSQKSIVVPAVPFHLAYAFAKMALRDTTKFVPVEIPQQIKPLLPHVWDGPDGSLLVSFADFRCPDDCPEPLYCTVTGEKRDRPLYQLLQELPVAGFNIHVIRSRQLAPGLGGYAISELFGLCSKLRQMPDSKWLLATSCKCHGVLNGFMVTRNEAKTLEPKG